MTAVYRLKGLGWLSMTALAAIGFYLVSSQVAAERKKLDDVSERIAGARRDIRALETEFDVRANQAQLERWNSGTFGLATTQAAQFVHSEHQLAALAPDGMAPAPLAEPIGSGAPVRTASLVVPAEAPVARAAALRPASELRPEGTAPRQREVAMLDRALLSDATLGDLASRARSERGGLR